MLRHCPALILCAALLPLAGCGPKLVPVTGTVTLDGKAVAGAAVTFTSEDGKHIATGETDDSGNFKINHTTGAGTFPGNYKVTVTKYPKVQGAVPNPDALGGKMDKDYEKAMKKSLDASKTGLGPAPMPGGKGGMMVPPGMMPGGGSGGSGSKSELPEIYASIEKTPLTAKVPSDGPIKLELKSKP